MQLSQDWQCLPLHFGWAAQYFNEAPQWNSQFPICSTMDISMTGATRYPPQRRSVHPVFVGDVPFFFSIGFHWSRPHFFGWTLTMAWLVIVGFLTSVPVYSDDHQSWLLPSGNQTANGHPPFIDDFPITTSLYRCHIWLPDGALGSWLPWRNPLRRKGRDTGWEWLGTTKDGIIMGLWCDYMIICDCYMGKSGLMIWDYNELHKIP